ncbi:hypothetical protein ABZ806_08670 [Spirillospora sp. NPDC047418]
MIENFDRSLCAGRNASVNISSPSVGGGPPAIGHTGFELHILREAD